MAPALSSSRAPNVRHVIPTPGRFWNEADQLVGLFERYREADDNANAAPCFGRLTRFQFEQLTSRPNYDSTKKSIVSAFQPQSGGTFLFDCLLQIGYQEFWWLFTHRMCTSVCYASDEALQRFLTGGCACPAHARPDPNILAALDRAGVEKIWVHLRNPAEAACSSYRQYLGAGYDKREFGEQGASESAVTAPGCELVPGVSKSSFVIEHIGWYIEWAAEWLRVAKERPGLVVLSYHDELSNLRVLLARVFDELSIEPPPTIESGFAARGPLREKSPGNWRQDLTRQTQDHLESRIRAKLAPFSACDRLWS